MMAVAKHVAEAHEDGIWTCAWTKQGHIVTGSVDECCSVWDANTLEQKKTFKKNLLGVVSVVSNSDGKTIATSSIDSVLRFWNPLSESSEPVGFIDAGPVEAWTLSFHPDDKTVISGTQKGTVNVWDVESCLKTQSFKGSSGEGVDAFVMSVAYSPDGAQIATGGLNGAINVWDAKSGDKAAEFEGHELPVRSISWSPGGQVLLSACDDSTVQAYDVARPGKPFETFYAHRSWALGVAFSPDNRHFATCSSDRTVKIWDLNMKTCNLALGSVCDETCLAYAIPYVFDAYGGGLRPRRRASSPRARASSRYRRDLNAGVLLSVDDEPSATASSTASARSASGSGQARRAPRGADRDVGFELPAYFTRGAGDTYFSGKMVAKQARLAAIAHDLGRGGDAAKIAERILVTARAFLDPESEETRFLYDEAWGGLVSCGCDFDEATESCRNKGSDDCPGLDGCGNNFGNGFYNDHHYHYGYWAYAVAVACRHAACDADLLDQIRVLAADFAESSQAAASFSFARHKDWYLGSSWASGVCLPANPNGRNQESS
ncbi:hypothetical protein JL720_963 [Aureococcus anophagefferens]|nr:hypothetical protein JL720_963 [Aureococcus anophagefferens]